MPLNRLASQMSPSEPASSGLTLDGILLELPSPRSVQLSICVSPKKVVLSFYLCIGSLHSSQLCNMAVHGDPSGEGKGP